MPHVAVVPCLVGPGCRCSLPRPLLAPPPPARRARLARGERSPAGRTNPRPGHGARAPVARAAGPPAGRTNPRPGHGARAPVARAAGGAPSTGEEGTYNCPACRQLFLKAWKLARHLETCCPDVYDGSDWAGVTKATEGTMRDIVSIALGRTRGRERAQREAVMRLAFGVGLPDGQAGGATMAVGQQRSHAEIGELMGLPPARVKRLLKESIREVPLVADPEPCSVLYEDEWLLVVSKPPGLRAGPIHRFQGGSLLNRSIGHLNGTQPYVLHRLDMYTSGVTMFGKTKEVAASVQGQFQRKAVHKTYYAIAAGTPGGGAGGGDFRVDAPLGPAEGHKFAQAVMGEGGQASQTDFRVVASAGNADLGAWGGTEWAELAPEGAGGAGGASLVMCQPLTGRTHQIRVHLASLGTPIVGDDIYGCTCPGLLPRMALHAGKLRLTHPGTLQEMEFSDPLPGDFVEAMAKLELACPPDLLPRRPREGGPV